MSALKHLHGHRAMTAEVWCCAGRECLPVYCSSHRQAVEQVREEAKKDDRDIQGMNMRGHIVGGTVFSKAAGDVLEMCLHACRVLVSRSRERSLDVARD